MPRLEFKSFLLPNLRFWNLQRRSLVSAFLHSRFRLLKHLFLGYWLWNYPFFCLYYFLYLFFLLFRYLLLLTCWSGLVSFFYSDWSASDTLCFSSPTPHNWVHALITEVLSHAPSHEKQMASLLWVFIPLLLHFFNFFFIFEIIVFPCGIKTRQLLFFLRLWLTLNFLGIRLSSEAKVISGALIIASGAPNLPELHVHEQGTFITVVARAAGHCVAAG